MLRVLLVLISLAMVLPHALNVTQEALVPSLEPSIAANVLLELIQMCLECLHVQAVQLALISQAQVPPLALCVSWAASVRALELPIAAHVLLAIIPMCLECLLVQLVLLALISQAQVPLLVLHVALVASV